MSVVYLVQSDTTVGFLSQNPSALDSLKKRSADKEYLKVYASFSEMKKNQARIPERYKKQIRRADKTTYIVKNSAFRVVQNSEHSEFLKSFKWMYSTSANKSGQDFEQSWCEEKADIIVYTQNAFESKSSSKIFRLHKRKKERLR